MSRTFHLSDILSITTGRLVSTRHMEGVYDILSYMCGNSLFTHQLPLAMRKCSPILLQQHPQLESIPEGFANEGWQSWLNQQVARFGQELPVSPLPTPYFPSIGEAMDAARAAT